MNKYDYLLAALFFISFVPLTLAEGMNTNDKNLEISEKMGDTILFRKSGSTKEEFVIAIDYYQKAIKESKNEDQKNKIRAKLVPCLNASGQYKRAYQLKQNLPKKYKHLIPKTPLTKFKLVPARKPSGTKHII